MVPLRPAGSMGRVKHMKPRSSLYICTFFGHLGRLPILVVLLNGAPIHAEKAGPDGLYQALTGGSLGSHALLKDHGLVVEGWAAGGFTCNPAHPSNRSNAGKENHQWRLGADFVVRF